MLVCELGGYVRPLPRGRLPHEVDVHPLAGQRAHVQRAVREAGRERLGAALPNKHVVGAVVGGAVAVVYKRENRIFIIIVSVQNVVLLWPYISNFALIPALLCLICVYIFIFS